MKSIMEEASSIVKAIEKGWIQAGKPQEFTIKVFEDATKNFLGFTSKPAKIGIFFSEKVVQPGRTQRPMREDNHKPYQQQKPAHAKSDYSKTPDRPYDKPAHKPQQKPAFSEDKYAQQQQPKVRPQHASQERPQLDGAAAQEKKSRDVWMPEMVDATQGWVQQTLALMGKGDVKFNLDAKNYYLKISFNDPIFTDAEKERLLFRNFAHLIMQSLRNKFKKSFRGFKIILSSSASQ